MKPKLHVFGHVHEGQGQEWLYYNELQWLYETIVTARGGVMNGLRFGWEWLKLCIGTGLRYQVDGAGGFNAQILGGCERRGRTLCVNAAVVGGLKDTLKREAVEVVL